MAERKAAGAPRRATWLAGALLVVSALLATAGAPTVGVPLFAFALLFLGLAFWSGRLHRLAAALQGAIEQLTTGGPPARALAALDELRGWTPRWGRRHLAGTRALALLRAGRPAEAIRAVDAALPSVPAGARDDLVAFRAYARARAGDAAGALADSEAALARSPDRASVALWAPLARALAADALGQRELARLAAEDARGLLDVHQREERALLRRLLDRSGEEAASVYRLAPAADAPAPPPPEADDLLAPAKGVAPAVIRQKRRTQGQAGAALAAGVAALATLVFALVKGARPAEVPWPEQHPGRTVGFELPGFDTLAPFFSVALVVALSTWVLRTVSRNLARADRIVDLAMLARRSPGSPRAAAARAELVEIAEKDGAPLAHAATATLAGLALEAGHASDALAWTDRALALPGLAPRTTEETRALRGLALACLGRADEAEAEATAAGTGLHVELRRYAIRLVVLLRKGDLAPAARLAEARADRLALQERFEALGLLARMTQDPALARAREHAWLVASWEPDAPLRAWVAEIAPPLAAAADELLAIGPSQDHEAAREAEAEAEAEEEATRARR